MSLASADFFQLASCLSPGARIRCSIQRRLFACLLIIDELGLSVPISHWHAESSFEVYD